jgi:hypothetical protein
VSVYIYVYKGLRCGNGVQLACGGGGGGRGGQLN